MTKKPASKIEADHVGSGADSAAIVASGVHCMPQYTPHDQKRKPTIVSVASAL